MIHQFYISSTALSSYQKMMINITNNVANAQTVGFKQSDVELESIFPGVLEEAVNSLDTEYRENGGKKRRIEWGLGVKVSDVRRDFKQGQVEITNRPLDLAIQGDGFFQLRLQDGTTAYSRAGNFQKDRDGNLIDPNGHLLDPSIRFPEGTSGITIDNQGRIFAQVNNEDQAREIGQVMLTRFSNPGGLQSIGQNLYVQTELSGDPTVGTPGRDGMGFVNQFSLEFSNVNVVKEMMKMVITQRAFELASKAIQSGEAMLKSAQDIVKGN